MKELVKELESVTQAANLDMKGMKKAIRRSIGETLRSFRAQVAQTASRELRVQANLFKNRTGVFLSKDKGDGVASTLALSIPGILIGAVQDQFGVKLKSGSSHKSAFITPVRRGSLPERVFRRKYLNRYSKEHPGYPIEEIRIPVENAVRKAHILAAQEADKKFIKNLIRNIGYIGGLL